MKKKVISKTTKKSKVDAYFEEAQAMLSFHIDDLHVCNSSDPKLAEDIITYAAGIAGNMFARVASMYGPPALLRLNAIMAAGVDSYLFDDYMKRHNSSNEPLKEPVVTDRPKAKPGRPRKV